MPHGHRAAGALPCRASFTRAAIQSLMSDSSQPTARRPSRTGFGKSPSLLYWASVLRDRPVRYSTCGRRRMAGSCSIFCCMSVISRS